MTGLPADLNANEVTKIAKGVASVIEAERAMEGSGDETKSEAAIDQIITPGGKPKIASNKTDNEKPKIEPKKGNTVNTATTNEAAAPVVANAASPQVVASLTNSQPKPTSVNSNLKQPTTEPAQVDMDSVNVVGNLQDASKTGDLDLLKNPAIVQKLRLHAEQQAAAQQAATNVANNAAASTAQSTAQNTAQSLVQNMKQKGIQAATMQQGTNTNGDSIGSPVSDIMPGLNGLLAVPPGGANSGGESHGNPNNQHFNAQEQQQGGNSAVTSQNDLPINHLTDYDILDVDLEGLNSMKKMIPTTNADGMAKFMDEKLDNSDIPSGFEDASFVGDRLNTEANEISNIMALKKKKIPKVNQTTMNSLNNNMNKVEMLKKSKVAKLPEKTKRSIINRMKNALTGKSIVVKAKSSVTVVIKHDKNNKPKP